MTRDPLDWLEAALTELQRDQLLRRRTIRIGGQGRRIRLDDRELLNFGANDYLGLADDLRLANAARAAVDEQGWGSGASPMVSGRTAAQAKLEASLAEFERTEAALVFPSGFAANVGTLTSLAGRGDFIFSDANNHASLIDGCRLSRAHVRIYDSADLASLQSELKAVPASARRVIVTDSLFSMSGELAPLCDLVELAQQYQAILVVDEAHATGVFGQHGRGVCEFLQVEREVPVLIGTLSKAVGSIGGFLAGPQRLIDWVYHRARTQMFSTALPAACHAASEAGLRIIVDEPHRRIAVLQSAHTMRAELADRGWIRPMGSSQVIPIPVGDAGATVRIARRLNEAGCFVPGIRPPTVPQGSSRLRISLSYNHSADDLRHLIKALTQVLPKRQ